jgi:hypothetical protein
MKFIIKLYILNIVIQYGIIRFRKIKIILFKKLFLLVFLTFFINRKLLIYNKSMKKMNINFLPSIKIFKSIEF